MPEETMTHESPREFHAEKAFRSNPVRSVCRGLKYFVISLFEFLSLTWVAVVVCLAVVIVGLPLLAPSFELLRSNAKRERRMIREDHGVEIRAKYLPFPEGQGLFSLRTWAQKMTDPTSWRDLVWHVLNPLVGAAIGLFPFAVLAHGVWGAYLSLTWGESSAYMSDSWYSWVYLNGPESAVLAGVWGIVEVAIALLLAGPVTRLYARWGSAVLSTNLNTELSARVESLSGSRRNVRDFQDAEIRRIERDLHDGAQARLVAMGMTLNRAERLLQENPEAAVELLRSAKSDSRDALNEIRDLVRGIRPPVLADRGLVAALQSAGMALELRTDITSSVAHRLPPALETALYFVSLELMTNAAKHAEASSITVRISESENVINLTIADDGVGFDPTEVREGGGISGARRRLAAFDGTLEFRENASEGTVAEIIIPISEA